MEIKVETTFNIDMAAERARLEKSFRDKPEAKARQTALLDAFEAQNWILFGELYDALPEDEEYECEFCRATRDCRELWLVWCREEIGGAPGDGMFKRDMWH